MNNFVESFGGIKGVLVTFLFCAGLWLFFDFVSANINHELALFLSLVVGVVALVTWVRTGKLQ